MPSGGQEPRKGEMSVSNLWLGLYPSEAAHVRWRGGKPKLAFGVMSIVVARDYTSLEREDISYDLGEPVASISIDNLDRPDIGDIVHILQQAGKGFYMLAWGNSERLSKKLGTERSYMPIKRTETGWAMCSRRPPYHVLSEFNSDTEMAQAIVRRMRAG